MAVRGAACLALANLGQAAGVEPLLSVLLRQTMTNSCVAKRARRCINSITPRRGMVRLPHRMRSDPELRKEAILYFVGLG